jgi:Xaa-Pro dipeptidase
VERVLLTEAPPFESADRVRLLGERLESVRRAIRDGGGDGALLWSRHNFAWLTLGGLNHVVLDSETGAVPILVTRERAIVLSPNIESARIADEERAALPLELEVVDWYEPHGIQARATELCPGRLLGDADLDPVLVDVRSVLAPVEHVRMTWLRERVDASLRSVASTVVRGTTENEVAAAVGSALAVDGMRSPVLLMAADELIERYRHPLPTDAAAMRRIMVVVVAERWGLHVASTTFVELEARSDELSRRFEAVAAVMSAMKGATQPGRTLGNVFDAARDAYAQVGFPDEWRLHHQGGTIGYRSRERVAVPEDPTVIKGGMAFAWNPSITGAKLEETFSLAADTAASG